MSLEVLDIANRAAQAGRRMTANLADKLKAEQYSGGEMKLLLQNDGIRPLPSALQRKIRRYARDRFGSETFAPGLIFYATSRGQFVEGWIPDNFFQSVAIRRINGRYHMTDNARTLQHRLLGPGVLPDLVHFVSGEWRSLDGGLLRRETIADLLFDQCEEVCVKAQESSKGRGIRFATRANFDLDEIERFGDFVVQAAIRQGEFYDRIFANAVTTIRVATAKLPGERPRALYVNLRIGRGEARVVTIGSIKVSVLDDEGSLASRGWDHGWRRHERHPDSGFVFQGARLPDHRRLVDFCVGLHDRIPQFGFVGWDVCVDREGEVRLLEINTGHPGIKFAEMSVGPCLGAFNIEQYARKPEAADA